MPKTEQPAKKYARIPHAKIIGPILERLRRSDALAEPIESPFGDTQVDPLVRKKLSKLEKRRLKKQNKERMLLPEPVLKDTPEKATLRKPPKEVKNLKDKLSNVVKVPEELLDDFMKHYKVSSEAISSDFLRKIAPAFLAFEDAMTYSSVAMRDGLSVDNEIDLEVMPLLEWVTRLSTIESFLKTLPLSPRTQRLFMRLAVEKAVEKCFVASKFKGFADGALTTDNKVAGIVTSMNKPGQSQPKTDAQPPHMQMLDNLNRLADAAKRPAGSAKKNRMSTAEPSQVATIKKKSR